MAQERRILTNFKFGTLDNAITNSATTAVSASFANLPAVSGTADYVPIVFFDASATLYEIVWVTAHTASSSTITIARNKESSGGTALAWGAGSNWSHAPTAWDGISSATSSTLPSTPFTGQRVIETDTGMVKKRTLNQGWQSDLGVALPSDVGPALDLTTYPPTSAGILIRGGHASLTTNASGDATCSYRVAFPNATLVAVPVGADPAAFGGDVCVSAYTASGFTARFFYPNGTVAASVSVKLGFVALGW